MLTLRATLAGDASTANDSAAPCHSPFWYSTTWYAVAANVAPAAARRTRS